jgi:hypothetical protein
LGQNIFVPRRDAGIVARCRLVGTNRVVGLRTTTGLPTVLQASQAPTLKGRIKAGRLHKQESHWTQHSCKPHRLSLRIQRAEQR